jgi:hypothetical protein
MRAGSAGALWPVRTTRRFDERPWGDGVVAMWRLRTRTRSRRCAALRAVGDDSNVSRTGAALTAAQRARLTGCQKS